MFVTAASLWYSLTLPANIRLGWKSLPGTYTKLVNYGQKGPITLGPGVSIIKILTAVTSLV
jgi:hypothetical protein